MPDCIYNGRPGYRSRPRPPELAQRFALCLDRNPLFTDVEVRLADPKRKGPTAPRRVYWRPKNPALWERILHRMQNERIDRAIEESPRYLFAPDPDGPFLRCESAKSEVYELDPTGLECTCPDDQRYRDFDLVCKHRCAWLLGLGQRMVETWPAWGWMLTPEVTVPQPAATLAELWRD